jgi:hypothetical protein
MSNSKPLLKTFGVRLLGSSATNFFRDIDMKIRRCRPLCLEDFRSQNFGVEVSSTKNFFLGPNDLKVRWDLSPWHENLR